MTASGDRPAWRPTADDGARRLRARVYRRVREFFHQRGVLEVETPLISAAGNTDPNIESIGVAGGGWLRSSPEFPMKRLLAAGSGPIYELGRVFRAGESGQRHNPEFTMLEWYRPGFELDQLMDEVAELVQELAREEGLDPQVEKASYAELVRAHRGIDPLDAEDAELLAHVREAGWYEGDLDRSACLDLILSLGVEPKLPPDRLLLVRDFPACQAALARIDEADPRVARRFELFYGGMELANGYDELLDPEEQAWRMAEENRRRSREGRSPMPQDRRLIEAMHQGLPAGAGVALGVDRLLLALSGHRELSRVINFPSELA